MKPLPHILLFVVLTSCLVALPVARVGASSSNDLAPNPAAEAYLLDALRTSGFANLKDAFPEAERNISSSVLVDALQDPQVQSHSLILIAYATVLGEVYANDLTLPGNLQLYRLKFTDYADFNSSLLHAVWIGESTFQGPFDLSFATFDGNVIICKNTFESLLLGRSEINGNIDLRDNTFNLGINMYGTQITGELLLDRSKILGTEPLPEASAPAEFWTTTVDGPASFEAMHFEGKAYFGESNFSRLILTGTTFNADVRFSGTTVEKTADFSGAQFLGKADFSNFYVGNTASFKGAAFNAEANFESATAVRLADFSDVTFNGPAKFDYFTAERFMDFINTTFNQGFSFYYATVAWPYFYNATFNGPVTFEGMQTSQDFEITDTRYNYAKEPFFAYLMHVQGAVHFSGFTAPAGIILCNGRFGNLSISSGGNPEIAAIDLAGTAIDGQLTIENVDLQSLIAEGASIGESTTLNQVSITKSLDLRNASLGFIKMDSQPNWPRDPEAFNLRGMTYTDIDLENQGLTEKTWRGVLELINQASYSPQAYQALSQFLADKGHPDWAAEVDLKQKRRERNEALTPLSGAWIWSWFLDIFVGYGHRPALAFIWSGLVIAIGAFVFRRKEDMLPVEQEDARVEYNPIWYSFALFLPYIDLGIACKWEPNPERKWARNYKYVHMLLGWILAPIALLTFGGIIG